MDTKTMSVRETMNVREKSLEDFFLKYVDKDKQKPPTAHVQFGQNTEHVYRLSNTKKFILKKEDFENIEKISFFFRDNLCTFVGQVFKSDVEYTFKREDYDDINYCFKICEIIIEPGVGSGKIVFDFENDASGSLKSLL